MANLWGNNVKIDLSEVENIKVPFHLKMLTINRGNKTFVGDLVIYANIPPQMTLGEITEVSKVKDNVELKSNLSLIPFLDFIALSMDNYKVIAQISNVDSEVTKSGRVKLVAKNMNLKPGEGVNLEYTTFYKMTGSDEMTLR